MIIKGESRQWGSYPKGESFCYHLIIFIANMWYDMMMKPSVTAIKEWIDDVLCKFLFNHLLLAAFSPRDFSLFFLFFTTILPDFSFVFLIFGFSALVHLSYFGSSRPCSRLMGSWRPWRSCRRGCWWGFWRRRRGWCRGSEWRSYSWSMLVRGEFLQYSTYTLEEIVIFSEFQFGNNSKHEVFTF